MKLKSVLADNLTKLGVSITCLYLVNGALAQKAELELSISKPDNGPTAGIVSILGSDTVINDSAFYRLRIMF